MSAARPDNNERRRFSPEPRSIPRHLKLHGAAGREAIKNISAIRPSDDDAQRWRPSNKVGAGFRRHQCEERLEGERFDNHSVELVVRCPMEGKVKRRVGGSNHASANRQVERPFFWPRSFGKQPFNPALRNLPNSIDQLTGNGTANCFHEPFFQRPPIKDVIDVLCPPWDTRTQVFLPRKQHQVSKICQYNGIKPVELIMVSLANDVSMSVRARSHEFGRPCLPSQARYDYFPEHRLQRPRDEVLILNPALAPAEVFRIAFRHSLIPCVAACRGGLVSYWSPPAPPTPASAPSPRGSPTPPSTRRTCTPPAARSAPGRRLRAPHGHPPVSRRGRLWPA